MLSKLENFQTSVPQFFFLRPFGILKNGYQPMVGLTPYHYYCQFLSPLKTMAKFSKARMSSYVLMLSRCPAPAAQAILSG